MTLLGGLFGEKATTLAVRDDIITSDRIIGELSSMFGSLSLSSDYTATYEEIVRKQLWVRTAVNKLAYATARLPLKTYVRNGDEVERAGDSDLAKLIRRPNQTKTTGTTTQLVARVAYDLYTYANAIIVKVQARPDAIPTELRPVSLRGCAVDDNGDYVWMLDNGRKQRFKPWQIIHIMEPGPSTNGFGISRLEAARLTLSIEYAAQRLGASTFNNGARPGGVLNVKGGLPSGSADRAAAVERFKSEIMRRFGGVDKAGLPAVLEGDVSWLAMSHNLDDSAVVSHRKLTREEVMALFDIPQPAAGILDEANFASIDALHLIFYQDSLGWPINLIEDVLVQQLIEGVPAFANHFVEFDLNAVLRGDIGKRATAYNQFLTAGVYTPNEMRRLENLPPIDPAIQPEADRIHVPMNLSGSEQSQEV